MRRYALLASFIFLLCVLRLSANNAAGWTQFVNCSQVTSSCFAGNSLWLSTNAGIIRFDTVQKTVALFSNGNADLGSNPRSLSADPNGVLWVATDRGLSKFSGGAWRFDSGTGRLPAGPMLSVAAAPAGRIYATGSYGGLYCYEGNAWQDFLEKHPGFPFPIAQRGSSLLISDIVLFVQYTENFANTRITEFSQGAWRTTSQSGVLSAAVDGRGGIWFLQGQESPVAELVHSCDTGFRKFTQPYASSYNLLVDPSGRLFRWSNYSLSYSQFQERDSSWIPGITLDTLSVAKLPFSSLAVDSTGILWGTFKAVNNSGGLVICTLKPGSPWHITALLPPPVLPSNSIGQIVEGMSDSVWILEKYYGNVSVWDGASWNKKLLSSSLGAPTELFYDAKGDLWISTGSSRIYHQSGSLSTTVGLRLTTDSIVFPLVKIAKDRDKNLWALGIRADLGGAGSGTMVYIFRLESGIWKPLPDSLRLPFSYTNLSFVRLCLDAGQESWIKIGDSLYTFTEQKGWHSRSDLLRRFNILYVSTIIRGKKNIWIGGNDKGIIRINGPDTLLLQNPGTASSVAIATPMAADTSDALWCSLMQRAPSSQSFYSSGIARCEGTGWQTFDSRSSGIPSEAVNDIMFDRFDRMWVATDNGIGMFDRNKVPVHNESRNPGANPPGSFPSDPAVDIQVRRGLLVVRTGNLECGTILANDINGRRLALTKIPSRRFSFVPVLYASALRIIVLSIDGIDKNGRRIVINKTVCLR